MTKEELLKIRKQIKKRKPKYTRHESGQREEVPSSWRKARGKSNKVRLGRRGHKKRVQIGYCSPKAVYGLNRKGLKEVLINNVQDLDKINKEKECAVISSTVGIKKKIVIIKKAVESNIKISNWKYPNAYLKQIEEKISKDKESKKAKKSKRDEKKKSREAKSKDKKKESLAEKVESEEEKKEKQKTEKDKLLMKRDM